MVSGTEVSDNDSARDREHAIMPAAFPPYLWANTHIRDVGRNTCITCLLAFSRAIVCS
jgi:hypothetical protein